MRVKLNPQQIAAIQAAWLKGARDLDLAIEYDVSDVAIFHHTKGKGLVREVQPRRGRPRVLVDHKRVQTLKAQGFGTMTIARRLGTSPATVSRIIHNQRSAQ
jgi:transposase